MDSELPAQPSPSSLTYESYLKVDALLDLQQVLTQPEEHDETLFIIIHQVYELWFKQILHEVERCCLELRQDKLLPTYSALKRIHTIQKVLIDQVSVLETMTPNDFNRFRARLNPASGFQSYQFRILEFRLGAKDHRYLKFFQRQPEIHDKLQQALQTPSLYLEFLRHFSRRGMAIPQQALEHTDQPHQACDQLTEVMLDIYRHPDQNYQVYMALELLIELDENLTLWRYRHVSMVERMIGQRIGTGGSSGVKYLTSTLSKKIFPEIWAVRNLLNAGDYGRPPEESSNS